MRALKIFLRIMLVVPLVANTASVAQAQTDTSYVPRLSDLMVVIQIRHSKLFYAVKARNWLLADYELEQLVGTLREAGRYYPSTAPPMTLPEQIRSSLSAAIKAKNEAKFDQAFDEMNAGCNRCHGAADRAFIVIRRPSYPSAFSNQMYSPRSSERDKQGH
jgi:cytochrome c553